MVWVERWWSKGGDGGSLVKKVGVEVEDGGALDGEVVVWVGEVWDVW